MKVFSKLKGLSPFKHVEVEKLDLSSITNNLCNGLFGVMEKAYAQRQSDPSNSEYDEEDVKKIIDQYARENMMIAAATSIVPGPFGILGAVPELLLNINNQMNMIYDLGCAHEKENFINKDILLDIPIAAFGGNTNLSALQDNSIDLTDSPETILVNKANELGKSIIEKTLKKSIVQFIPVAGPILMSTWAKLTTRKISKNSLSFLSQKETYQEHLKPEENPEIKRQLQQQKIKGLANLIESNNEINEDQIELFGVIIENADLNEEEKAYYLKEAVRTGSKFDLDKKLLIDYEEADDLVMEMVVMAKRSGIVDEFERAYIFEVANSLGMDKQFVEDLF